MTHSHGMTGTYEHNIWRGIKARVNDKKTRYAKAGIGCCDRWMASFEAWYEDMGKAPGGFTIDRIDGTRGYECGKQDLCVYCKERNLTPNCRWASVRDQAVNRKSTRWIEFNGKNQCMEDWAIETGISPPMLLRRIQRGWTIEQALTLPSGTKLYTRWNSGRITSPKSRAKKAERAE